jgi:hypothetical protein
MRRNLSALSAVFVLLLFSPPLWRKALVSRSRMLGHGLRQLGRRLAPPT